MEGLEKVVQILMTENIQAQLWIDGSFLTKKIDPFDSDMLVMIQGDFYANASPKQKAVIDWLKTDLTAGYYCHSFLHFGHPAGHPEYDASEWDRAYWLRQFGFSRKNERKGIATINIP
jgi:hypothetical protein